MWFNSCMQLSRPTNPRPCITQVSVVLAVSVRNDILFGVYSLINILTVAGATWTGLFMRMRILLQLALKSDVYNNQETVHGIISFSNSLPSRSDLPIVTRIKLL